MHWLCVPNELFSSSPTTIQLDWLTEHLVLVLIWLIDWLDWIHFWRLSNQIWLIEFHFQSKQPHWFIKLIQKKTRRIWINKVCVSHLVQDDWQKNFRAFWSNVVTAKQQFPIKKEFSKISAIVCKRARALAKAVLTCFGGSSTGAFGLSSAAGLSLCFFFVCFLFIYIYFFWKKKSGGVKTKCQGRSKHISQFVTLRQAFVVATEWHQRLIWPFSGSERSADLVRTSSKLQKNRSKKCETKTYKNARLAKKKRLQTKAMIEIEANNRTNRNSAWRWRR